MSARRPKRPGEGAFGILMLALGLFLAWQAYRISGFAALSSPGAFPMAAAAAMVIAALVVVVGDLRKPHEVDGPIAVRVRSFSESITPSVVVVFTGCVIGYSALLDTLGFLPASFLFLLVAIRFLHGGSLRFSVLVSIAALAAIYVVFRLVFTVVLPEGIVPEREIMAWIKGAFRTAEAQ